jgi:hypothetical protein
VGSLIYLTTTRPDISFVIGILSRFMQNPCEVDWSIAKRVLKFLKGTQDFGLGYSKVDEFNLIVYYGSKFVGYKETRLSTSGYLMILGSTVFSWRSSKQSVPPYPTIEGEYVAVLEATKEIAWLKKILDICKRNK